MQIRKVLKVALISVITSNILYANEIKTTRLSSVTVTANKVEENLQDIPQAITVIDEVMIQEKGLDTVEKILNQIPNINVITSNGNGSYMNYRGLNTSTFTSNNPVVIFVDGVPTSNIYGYDALIENIQRIEVLRGPQGTLYGKDAIGAVVNIITKKPINATKGSINAEYGSDNYMLGRFHLNGPIINNKLYFGLASELKSDDGWATNNYNADEKSNKSESQRLDGHLLYKVSDNLSFKLSSQNAKTKVYGYDGIPNLDFSTYSNPNPYTPPDNPATPIKPTKDQAKNQYYIHPTFSEVKTNSQSLGINYTFDNFELTSLTINKKSIHERVADDNYQYVPLFGGFVQDAIGMLDTEVKNLSQELRLSNTKNIIKWVGGLYYEDEDTKNGPNYGTKYYYSQWTGLSPNNGFVDAKMNSDTYAIFGQAVIPLREKLELTVGARYQKIKKDVQMKRDVRGNIFSINKEKNWNEFLPKIALSYKINENYTTYLSYSQGYMPGGFNFFPQSSTENISFEPQTSKNYELGLKASLEDSSFGINIFRMDIEDVHLFGVTSSGGFYTGNAKGAYSQGIEIDGIWYPSDNWEISGSIGIISSKYDKNNEVHANRNMNSIPKYNGNLGIGYYHPDGFYARTDINFVGKTYYHDDAYSMFGVSGWIEEDSYITTNLKLGYKYDKWDFYVYSNNITDKEYITWHQKAYTTFGEGRFIGTGIRYSF